MANDISDMQQNSNHLENAYWDDLTRFLTFSFFLGINIAVIMIYVTYTSNAKSWPLRHSLLIIVIAVTILILIVISLLRLSKALLIELYKPEADQSLNRIILRRLFGIPVPPFLKDLFKHTKLIIKDGRLNHLNHPVTWLGGPVVLMIMDNSAVYLERGNRFSRVVGSGRAFVHRNEIVRHVIDLRKKDRSGKVSAWTKDGIRVNVELQLTYQIKLEKSIDSIDMRDFPVDPIATKQAIEATAVRYDKDHGPVEFDWLDGAWGRTIGILTKFISGHNIDELIREDSEKGKTVSSFVEKNLLTELNRELEKIGVNAKNPHIKSINYPERVKNLLREVWAAERRSISRIEEGKSHANQLRIQLETKLEAQRGRIQAIVNSLENMSDEQFAQHFSLSVTSDIGLNSGDSTVRVQMTNLILELLAQFKDLTQFDNEY